MHNDFLTTSQAAKVFHVTRFTVLNWIKVGKLPALTTPGGHHRISRKALLDAFSASQHPRSRRVIPNMRQNTTEKNARAVPRADKPDIAGLLKKSLYASGKYFASLAKKKRGGGEV